MRAASMLLAAAAAWAVVMPSGVLPSGRRLPNFRAVVAVVGSITAPALIIWSLTGDGVLAAALGGITAVVLHEVAHTRRDGVRRSRGSRWPDLLTAMRSRLAAGETMTAATLAAARSIGPPFDSLADALADEPGSTAPGASYPDALDGVAREWADPLADRVLATLTVAHRVGGPRVGDVLARLSTSVTEDLRLRLAHEAATTEQRLTALVALVAPWALLILTVATNPAAAGSFAGGGGRLIILIGLGATAAGYVLTRRSLRLSSPPKRSA